MIYYHAFQDRYRSYTDVYMANMVVLRIADI